MSDINMALLNEFIDEAREHLDEMESLLLQLAGDDVDIIDILNNIFRTIHNIKGGSQLTGLEKISTLSHRLEDLLDLLRNEKMQINDEILETLISGRDRIVAIVNELEIHRNEQSDVEDLVIKLMIWIESDGQAAPATTAPATTSGIDAAQQQIIQAEENVDEYLSSARYHEEHDRELYDIFHSHLKEQFTRLLRALAQFDINPEVGLNSCKSILSSLRSSANYMCYESLLALYSQALSFIEQAQADIRGGRIVSRDDLDRVVNDLVVAFPELREIQFSAGDGETDSGFITDQIDADESDITASVMVAFENEFSPQQLSATAEGEIPVPAETVANVTLFDEFIEETGMYLQDLETLLIKLGDDPGNTEVLNEIFRNVHNIKGGANLTGLDKLSRLSLRFEDLLELLRTNKKSSNTEMVDAMILVRDRIVQLVRDLEEKQSEVAPVDDLIEMLNGLIESDSDTTLVIPGVNDAKDIVAGFDEENDRELFEIFLEHLKQQLAYIVQETELLVTQPMHLQHIAGCSAAIRRLWSSANYMGYDHLTTFYDKWSSVIDQVQRVFEKGETVSLDFMRHYLDDLLEIFPQVGDVRNIAVHPEYAGKDVVDEQTQAGQISIQMESGDLHSGEDIDQLFNRLNSALENSLASATNQDIEALHEVYDELISSGSRVVNNKPEVYASAPVVTEVKKKPKSTAVVQEEKTEKPEETAEVAGKETDKKNKATTKTTENKIRKSVRVDAEKIDALMNQVGELVVDRSYFFQLFNEMRGLQSYLKEKSGVDQKEIKMLRAFTYRLGEAISALGRTSNELQEGVMKMRMMPISHIFNRYPRLVHDLTRNSNKKIKLEMYGEDTELDKMIVEELSDPLIHIIRNAIDHGLESVEERMRLGKPEAGKLVLDAYQESNHIVIEVTDDGRGISTQRIRDKAISKGMHTADELERMSHRDLIQLIMTPGFSTAEKITGTSGRGVGMDVVKKNIEKLNGTLEIESKPGIGSQMRLKIPLTLAIIHALMIRVGSEMFTIPLANVDETVRINNGDTSLVEGVEVIHLRGEALPIFHLSNIFNVKNENLQEKSFVVIVSTDGKRTGFVVDELLGQEEVVIKPLADYVQEKSGFSGATIIGDGRISLILDVYELVKMTASRLAAKHRAQTRKLKAGMHKRIQISHGDARIP